MTKKSTARSHNFGLPLVLVFVILVFAFGAIFFIGTVSSNIKGESTNIPPSGIPQGSELKNSTNK